MSAPLLAGASGYYYPDHFGTVIAPYIVTNLLVRSTCCNGKGTGVSIREYSVDHGAIEYTDNEASPSAAPSMGIAGQQRVTPAPRDEAKRISVQFGHQAIDGLTAQIADAIRSGDYERTVALQHIRRNVELLLQATQMLRFELAGRRTSGRSFQERQASFVFGNIALPMEAAGTASAKRATAMEDLTPREREIIEHLAHGATNKAIARNLDIAEATVKVHIKTLLRKLHLKNRTQAALWAVQQGV